MDYIDQSLSDGERVVAKFHLHWGAWLPVGWWVLLPLLVAPMGLTHSVGVFLALLVGFSAPAVWAHPEGAIGTLHSCSTPSYNNSRERWCWRGMRWGVHRFMQWWMWQWRGAAAPGGGENQLIGGRRHFSTDDACGRYPRPFTPIPAGRCALSWK